MRDYWMHRKERRGARRASVAVPKAVRYTIIMRNGYPSGVRKARSEQVGKP